MKWLSGRPWTFGIVGGLGMLAAFLMGGVAARAIGAERYPFYFALLPALFLFAGALSRHELLHFPVLRPVHGVELKPEIARRMARELEAAIKRRGYNSVWRHAGFWLAVVTCTVACDVLMVTSAKRIGDLLDPQPPRCPGASTGYDLGVVSASFTESTTTELVVRLLGVALLFAACSSAAIAVARNLQRVSTGQPIGRAFVRAIRAIIAVQVVTILVLAPMIHGGLLTEPESIALLGAACGIFGEGLARVLFYALSVIFGMRYEEQSDEELNEVHGLDEGDKARLEEAGLGSVHALALSSTADIFAVTRVQIPRIVDWQKQAIDLHARVLRRGSPAAGRGLAAEPAKAPATPAKAPEPDFSTAARAALADWATVASVELHETPEAQLAAEQAAPETVKQAAEAARLAAEQAAAQARAAGEAKAQ